MDIRFHNAIAEIDPAAWNTLLGGDYPFMRHEFLHALEASGSVAAESGWQPCHLTLTHNNQLLAALPLYQKVHSWGEYVFDWSWADAYRQLGLPYYPKLLSAPPFTPASGPRLLIANPANQAYISQVVLSAIQEHAAQEKLSGWHLLFPNHRDDKLLADLKLQRRTGTQFHWHNRGYGNFEDFLNALNARKRKGIRSERRKIGEQKFNIEWLSGEQISRELWQTFYRLYHRTYLKRSGATGYLTEDFFHRLGSDLPKQVLMAVASDAQSVVACSLFFHDSETLYGRYWGAMREYDTLHFELCYYQGIEYAIRKGLKTFDAGAQGEHKIQRGFEPVETCSYHWLADERFDRAIEQFLREERQLNKRYMADARNHLPFKKG